MKCEEVRNLLSAYVDEELPSGSRPQVTEHLKGCAQCADELASFQHLSKAAGELHHPELPADIWKSVEAQLDADRDPVSVKQSSTYTGRVFRWASIAALFLIAATLGYFGYHNLSSHDHDELTADFSEYLDAFRDEPAEAHLVLVNKYGGEAVDLGRAHVELGYRPTLADGLPAGYTIETSFVMDMPCCKCIKTICRRSDGGTLAVFEHDDEQPVWFGDRPSIQTECGGELCMLTQMDSEIAVSWQHGSRHLTVVGAKDADEAALLVGHLSSDADSGSDKSG